MEPIHQKRCLIRETRFQKEKNYKGQKTVIVESKRTRTSNFWALEVCPV